MSERINISIPGELNERMSHFKDRLNMSRICQEAIAHVVRLEEIKAKAIPDIDSLAARLKEEKMQYGKDFIEKGFECGIKDAYGMSLDTFLEIQFFREGDYLGKLAENQMCTYEDMFSFASKKTEKSLEDLENDNYAGDKWGLETMLQPTKFFVSGWLKGVGHIWDKVKPEVLAREVVKPEFVDPKSWGMEEVPEES